MKRALKRHSPVEAVKGITAADAVFYIALHPQQIDHGTGAEIAQLTLQFGLEQSSLQRIYLKMRK